MPSLLQHLHEPRPAVKGGGNMPTRKRYAHITFEMREQATLEIFEYIECSYNRVRIHSALGNLGPVEFEARNAEEAAPEAA